MKLAEALAQRSDLNRKLGELRARISDNMYTSKDRPAAEDAGELLQQTSAVAHKLEELIVAINTTNTATTFDLDGQSVSLTQALARRDRLGMEHKTMSEALGEVSGRRGYWREERTGKLAIDVASLREKADACARELRALDLHIQQVNWTTELS